MTIIENHAFNDCYSLSGELRLTDSLTSINKDSFVGCDKIERFIFHNPYTAIEGILNPFSSTILCGYRNSTAEEYARENGLAVEELKPAEQ